MHPGECVSQFTFMVHLFVKFTSYIDLLEYISHICMYHACLICVLFGLSCKHMSTTTAIATYLCIIIINQTDIQFNIK